MNTAEQFDYNADAIARLEAAGGTCIIELSDTKSADWDDSPKYRPHYRVTLKSKRGQYTLDFWGSIADGENGTTATVYDVLAGLQWDCPETFEEFCLDFGYDEDSRKPEKAFRKVRTQAKGLARVFTAEQRQSLSEIS